jgi:hypothetical protein
VKLLFFVALTAFAQPKIDHAKLETSAVSGSLDAQFRQIVSASAGPAWIGYTVAQVPGERSMCGTVNLEGAREFVLLYRVEAGQLEKIRTYATDCSFDAGDLPVYWLTGVDGAQSAALLATYIDAKPLANSVISAIARHQDGVPALIELVRRPGLSPQLRQEAMRSLGRSKDPRAIKFFEQILATR